MKKKIDIQAFRDFLKKSNNNFSVEREALFNVMLSMKGCYSAEEFFKTAHRKNAVHDKTTVYRVLPLFMEAGFIKVTILPNGRKQYETMHEHIVRRQK